MTLLGTLYADTRGVRFGQSRGNRLAEIARVQQKLNDALRQARLNGMYQVQYGGIDGKDNRPKLVMYLKYVGPVDSQEQSKGRLPQVIQAMGGQPVHDREYRNKNQDTAYQRVGEDIYLKDAPLLRF